MKNNYSPLHKQGLITFILAVSLLISSVFVKNANAQPGTATYINTNVAATGNNAFPFNTTANIKIQWIYAPGTFSTLGGGTGTPAPSGMAISKVYIQFAVANPTTVYPNLTISLGQNVGTQANWGTVSSTTYPFTTGLTTCFFQASGFQFSGNVANAWYGITLQTPFPYDPSLSLVVEAKSTLTTAGGNGVRTQTAVTGQMQRVYGPYANTTGTSNTLLTPFGFDLISTSGCTAPPTPGASTATPSSGMCTGANILLNLSGNSVGTGQTYQWQSSAAIGGPYTNLGSSQTAPGLTTPATSTLYYRCEVTCSGNTQISTPVLVTVNPALPGGSYTINAGAPASSTNFQSFNAFKTALSCGIAGAIVANVVAASGPYTEQIEFTPVGGASAVNTITINGNGNTLTFGATVSTAPGTLILNGADYFTFNNLNITGTGATYALTVHLWAGANNNTFSGCTISSPVTAASTTQVPYSISGTATAYSGSGLSGNNNILTGCTITGGYYAVTLYSTTTLGQEALNNTVSNNTIRDAYSYQVYALYQSGAVISGNDISRPNKNTSTTTAGVYISTGDIGCLVEKNRIHNMFDALLTNTSTCYGLANLADGTAALPNRFENNLIYDMNGNGAQYGLYNSTGPYAKYYHNTIAFHDQATTTGAAYGFYQTGATSGIEYFNNIVSITRSGTGVKRCIYFLTTTTGNTSNNNVLYMNSTGGTNNHVGQYVSTNYTTLANWQTANANAWDQASVDADPLFINPGTGDYTPTSGLVNNIGTNVNVATDILGSNRSASTPDPGAYEFDLVGLDASISWVSPTSPAVAGTYPVTVNINNTLSTTIVSLDLSYTDGSTVVNESFTGLNIPGGTNQNISFTTQYNLVSSVTMTVSIGLVNGVADDVSGNNTDNYALCISLSGAYTINAGAPVSSTNFQSFSSAFNALACGIANPITFNVVAGSGPYNDQVNIPDITGVSSVNTITINGNGNTLTNGTVTGNYATLNLNGADYITFNNLIITASDATSGFAVHLMNSSDNNTFSGCTMNASLTGTGTTTACVSMSGSTTSYSTTGTHGTNNLFTGCTTNGGYFGFVFYGNTSGYLLNANNSIVNCIVQNYYVYGAYNYYQGNSTISGNIFQRPTRATVSTGYGVMLTTGCVNMLVEKNRVRKMWDAAPASTGTTYCLYNASTSATAGNENKFYNNLVSDINFNGTIYGMYLSGANYIKVYHNTISLDQTGATGTTTTYGIYATGTLARDIRNNIVTISRGGTGVKYCLYYTTPATVISNYNDLYMNSAAGTNYIGYNGTSTYATLALWQGIGFDANSVSTNPLYIAPGTGNYKPGSSTLDNIGTGLGITDDILNASRSAIDPDPGAYEFSVSPKDAGVITLIAPGTEGCYSGSETITVEIKNYGSTTLDFSVDPLTVTCNVTGTATATLTGSPTGTLPVAGTMNVTMSTTLDMTANGTYTFNAFTTMTSDGNPDNNPMLPDNRSAQPVAGTVSSTQTSICVSGTPTISVAGNSGGAIQWQQSTASVSGPWTNVGTGGTSYTPASAVTQTTYYRAEINCNTNSEASNVVTVTVTTPQITGTTDATRCGIGSVTLQATATGQGTINWFNTPTGGTSLGTGGSFTTNVSATTTFYAEETTAGGSSGASPIQITEADLGTNDQLEIQNVSGDPVNVTGWKVAISDDYSIITAVNPNIQVLSGTMNPGATMTWTDLASGPNYWGSNMFWNPGAYPSFTGWAAILDNNNILKDFVVWNWPSANIQGASITVGTTTITVGTQWIGNGIDASAVLATQSLSRQGSLDDNDLTDFSVINLSVGSTNPGMTIPFTGFGCSSTRVSATATVTPPPALSISAADMAVCNASSTTVSVNSINDPDYTYSWTSNPAGFTASGAGPHTVSPAVTTYYIVSASDNSSGPNAGCVAKDSIQIVTGGPLAPGTVAASQTTFCNSGTPTLTVTGADGGAIQWQSSTTSSSGPWNNVGTGAAVYNAGSLTQTTWFRVTVSCQSSSVTSNVETVNVNTPSVTSSTGATRCGVGNVTLQATGSSGTTLNWYNASTGGSPLGTGTNFTTNVTGSTNFYVGASSGGGGTATATMPAQTTTFANNVRGYWFTAPSSFTITGVRVPLAGTGQNIAVVRFTGNIPPPTFSATTNAFTTLFLTQGNPSTGVIPCNVSVSAGDVIGVLGQVGSGTTALTSYGPLTNPTFVTIAGSSVGLTRMGMQFPLTTTAPQQLWQEIGAAVAIGRVEFEYTTGCESSPRTAVPVTVTPAPTVNASSSTSATICIGQSATLTATSTNPGYTYIWNPGSLSGASVSVSPTSNTTYTVSATDVSGGIYHQCAAVASITVNGAFVNAPTALASSNSPVCEGFNLTFFGDNTTSGQGSGNTWSWSGPSFTSSVQNPSINGATATAAGAYTLTVTNSVGCTSSASHMVVVNPNPVLSIATQTNVSCNGDADGAVDIDANNGTPAYLFDLGGNSTLDGIYTGLAAGTYTASVIDDNGCEATPTLTVTITEPDVLTVAAGSNSPVCTGTALNLTSTPAGGTAGFTYAWTGPNSFTSTAQDPTISSVTAADAGQYDLQVTDDHGCIANTNHTVTVIAAPTAAISNFGNNNICLSQPATVTLTFTGTGPWNYTVSDGTQTVSGSSPTSPVNINITPTTAGTHNYTVTAVGNAGCPAGGTSTGSATVFVSTAPPTNNAGPVTPSSPEACSGTVLLINTTTITGQNVRYSWNTGSNSGTVLYSTNIGGPFSPPPFQTTSPTVYAQFGALAGSSGYNVCVQGTNGCGSGSNKCTWIRGVVSVPGAISPANPVACPNNVKTYSCGTSAGATVYNWTLSGSATPITSGQGTQNVTVTFPAVFTSGQLCVTAALACGGSSTSAPRCMTISNTPAVPGTMTGPAKVCPGATGVVFSVAAVTGATGYNWTVPAGCTITSGTNTPSITVNFPNPYTGAPPVCVSATSACGSGVARCKTVGSNLPTQPGAIAGPVTNICNSTVQYSIANVPGASSYTWTPPAGTSVQTGQGTTTILLSVGASFTTGNLTVTANTTACTPGTSLPRTISIFGKPNTPANITANPAIWCTGGFVNFSVATVSPLPVYNWTTSNGTITAGQGTDNIDVTWGATAAGTVNVTAGNTCGTSTVRSQSFSSGCREEGKELAAGSGQLTVYPNPAHDKVTVSIYVKEASQFNIKLRDISGRVILSEDHDGAAGLNVYDMELQHFAKGIYTLEVQSSSERWKAKVVIE